MDNIFEEQEERENIESERNTDNDLNISDEGAGAVNHISNYNEYKQKMIQAKNRIKHIDRLMNT